MILGNVVRLRVSASICLLVMRMARRTLFVRDGLERAMGNPAFRGYFCHGVRPFSRNSSLAWEITGGAALGWDFGGTDLSGGLGSYGDTRTTDGGVV